MKKFFVLILLISITFLGTSCKKYLDMKQDAKLAVPDKLTDLQALLNNDGIMNNSCSPSFGETSADDYFMNNTMYNSKSENYQSWYIWKPYFDPNLNNDWGTVYLRVYYTNLVLDQLKNISRNTANGEAYDNVRGAALFYRSYYFLSLLWNYAKAYDSSTAKDDLGIALRTTSDFNVKSFRASDKDCYQQVINDTKESISLLPSLTSVPTQPSQCAAYGLLARCYLSMRDYKNALLYADSSLRLNSSLMDYNGDDQINPAIRNPFSDYNKENILYMQMNTNYYDFRTSQGYSRIDTSLFASYSDDDLRKTLFFKDYGDGYQAYYGTYTTSGSYYFSGIATDEMYLIRSECNIRQNQTESGLQDLNTLLMKRYKTGTYHPYLNLSEKDALNVVLEERRKELLMRGIRWMDIKRLNKEGRDIILKRIINGTTYTLMPNDNYYALPLPEDIIRLTGMPQNPL